MDITSAAIATLISAMLLSLSSHAQAERVGRVAVRDNIANPAFPTHIISLYPKRTERGASDMTVRCQNNRTEVYIDVDGVYGHRGITRVKWPKMASAQDHPTIGSTDGRAVFISNPIAFVQKLVSEQTVVIEVEGYNVFGAAEYRLNEETTRGIYTLATTCQWIDRLPKNEVVLQFPTPTLQESEANTTPTSTPARTECEQLTEQFERRGTAVKRLDMRSVAYWTEVDALLDLNLERKRACE